MEPSPMQCSYVKLSNFKEQSPFLEGNSGLRWSRNSPPYMEPPFPLPYAKKVLHWIVPRPDTCNLRPGTVKCYESWRHYFRCKCYSSLWIMAFTSDQKFDIQNEADSEKEAWITKGLKGKGKIVPVLFNWGPHFEDALREWRYSPMHFWPRNYMEVTG